MPSITRLVFAFILMMLFSLPGYSHQDPKIDSENTNKLIDLLFIKTQNKNPSFDAIAFSNPKKQVFHVERNEIARSMSQAIIQYYLAKNEEPHKKGCCGHHHEQVSKNALKWSISKIKGLHEAISDFVYALPSQIKVAPSEAFRMSKRLGVVPTVFLASIFVVTYPPYTLATEVLESMALGPFHVHCTFFQTLYFAAFGSIVTHVSSFSRFVHSGYFSYKAGIKNPIINAWTSLSMSKDFQKSFKNILIQSVSPQVMNIAFSRKEAISRLPSLDGQVDALISSSRYWVEYFFTQSNFSKNDFQINNSKIDFDYRLTFLEDLSALKLISQVVSARITQDYQFSKSTQTELVFMKKKVGLIEKQIAKLETVVLSSPKWTVKKNTPYVEKIEGLIDNLYSQLKIIAVRKYYVPIHTERFEHLSRQQEKQRKYLVRKIDLSNNCEALLL